MRTRPSSAIFCILTLVAGCGDGTTDPSGEAQQAQVAADGRQGRIFERVTIGEGGETTLRSERAEVAAVEASAAVAAPGVPQPNAYHLYFDLGEAEARATHDGFVVPVIDRLRTIGVGPSADFGHAFTNIPTSIVTTARSAPCNYQAILAQTIDFLRTYVPRTYTTIFADPRAFPIVLHPPTSCPGKLGEATIGPVPVGLPGIGTRALAIAFEALDVTANRGVFQSTLAKLYGFAYGLRPANAMRCSSSDGFFAANKQSQCESRPSADPFSIMGIPLAVGDVPGDFSPIHRDALGWLPASRVARVAVGDPPRRIALADSSLQQIPAGAVQEVRVPIDTSRYYSLSFQPALGGSTNPGNSRSGVLVRLGGVVVSESASHLLDMHPRGGGGAPVNAALDCTGGQNGSGVFYDDDRGIAIGLAGCEAGAPRISASLAEIDVTPYESGIGVVNSADYDANKPLTPGGSIAIFGNAMSGEVAQSAVGATELAGTSVGIIDESGQETPLDETYVSPTQINGRLRPTVKPGKIRLIVRPRAKGTRRSRGEATVGVFSPSFYTAGSDAQGYVVRVEPTGAQRIEPLRGIDLSHEGDRVFLVLYGTGFRGARAASDIECSLFLNRPAASPPKVFGTGVEPAYVGAVDHVGAGVDQINIEVPSWFAEGAGTGGVGTVACSGHGRTSNTANLSYR